MLFYIYYTIQSHPKKIFFNIFEHIVQRRCLWYKVKVEVGIKLNSKGKIDLNWLITSNFFQVSVTAIL